MKNYQAHKTAIVESNKIGRGTRIWAFVHILKDAIIGMNVNICDHCFIENKVVIGDNVTIKSGVFLWDGVTIENNVFIGPSVSFANDRYPKSKNTNYKQEKIMLKIGSSIGSNATILPGISVGRHALVGAGSVVTKNVEDFSIVFGNPASQRGFICACKNKLIFNNKVALCVCGKKYELNHNKPRLI